MRLRALFFIVVIAACSDSTGPKSTPIGLAGGTVVSGDGIVTLRIPSGAFSTEQQLIVRGLSSAELARVPGAFPGMAYAIEPDGLSLSAPGTVSIRVSQTALGQTPFDEIVIARPGTAMFGDELPTSRSTGTEMASAPIDRLGIVWVRAARVARIAITPPTPTAIAGKTVSLTATPLAADGRPLNRAVTWTVRSSAIATIETTGLLQAAQPGSTWVVAQSESVQDSILVRVSPLVAHLDIQPPNLTVLTGDTIQLQAVARDDKGSVVSDAVVSWRSSDPAAASISADGTLIAKRSGSFSIVASIQDVSATAPLTVQDVATIDQISNAAGNPQQLTSLAGPTVLDIHVAPIAAPVKAVIIEASCGRSSVAIPAPPPDASGLTHGRFPTDSVDIGGHALFPNGPCTVSVAVATSQGSIRSSPAIDVVLSNHSSFSATYVVSGANAPFGAPYPTSYTSTDGRVWRTGSVSLQLVARNFDNGQAVTQVSGTFLGKTFDVTIGATDGRFTIPFPNLENDPSGRNIAGFASPPNGSYPTITKASFADGTAAFVALQASPLYLDNQAPQAPSRFSLPAINASIGWVAGAYQLVAPSNYSSAGDGSGVGGVSVLAFAGPAQSTSLLPGGTTTGAACSVGAMRGAVTGADAIRVLADPSTVTNRSLVARAFETDRLGNVRCTDLSSGVFGVDVVPPTLVRAATSTPDKTIYGFQQSHPPIRFDVSASDGQAGLPDPHIVHRTTIAWLGNQGFCLVGWNNGCVGADAPDTLTVHSIGDAHWVDYVVAIDRVGNRSVPLTTDLLDVPNDRPGASWSGFPSVFVGGSTFNLGIEAASGLGLYRVMLGMDYSYARANMRIEVAADTIGDRWALNLLLRWQGSLTIRNFMRQLEMVDASDAPYDDQSEYTRAYAMYLMAENIGGTQTGPFYGLGDKNMPVGFTYYGKGIRQFRMTTPVSTVSNAGASNSTVGLSAAVTTDLAAPAPFASVCFYYQHGGEWRPAGCTSSATVTTTATTRTLDYRTSLNPPATLGTSGTLVVRAIGLNTTGDGLSTNSSNAVTIVP